LVKPDTWLLYYTNVTVVNLVTLMHFKAHFAQGWKHILLRILPCIHLREICLELSLWNIYKLHMLCRMQYFQNLTNFNEIASAPCTNNNYKLRQQKRSLGSCHHPAICWMYAWFTSRDMFQHRLIQNDQKVTQPILKYLSMVAIQYISTRSINTTSLWLYKNPRRLRHVVTCSRQSVSSLSTVEVQECFFHKCDECSL
jgi:hypothetical protein